MTKIIAVSITHFIVQVLLANCTINDHYLCFSLMKIKKKIGMFFILFVVSERSKTKRDLCMHATKEGYKNSGHKGKY